MLEKSILLDHVRVHELSDPRVGTNNKFECTKTKFFKKMGHSRPLFLYFSVFNKVDSKHYSIKTLLVSGIELQTSGVVSNRSAN